MEVSKTSRWMMQIITEGKVDTKPAKRSTMQSHHPTSQTLKSRSEQLTAKQNIDIDSWHKNVRGQIGHRSKIVL